MGVHIGATWHQANTIKRFMRGGDAACRYHYCGNLMNTHIETE